MACSVRFRRNIAVNAPSFKGFGLNINWPPGSFLYIHLYHPCEDTSAWAWLKKISITRLSKSLWLSPRKQIKLCFHFQNEARYCRICTYYKQWIQIIIGPFDIVWSLLGKLEENEKLLNFPYTNYQLPAPRTTAGSWDLELQDHRKLLL